MQEKLTLGLKGIIEIHDDTEGRIVRTECNDIHPRNMARVISRALSNESNYFVHRIAFGNGGSFIDNSGEVSYKSPNIGETPDVNTWDSRLHNEVYSEIVDDSSVAIGTDPGSVEHAGGGANPINDPTTITHVSGPGVRSNELGKVSEVVIVSVLNPSEPATQDNTGVGSSINGDFTFDEIGLYTAGGPPTNTNGIQNIDVGNKKANDDSTLTANTQYSFAISVDNGAQQVITFTTPPAGGSGPNNEILYGDIIQAIMTGNQAWNNSAGDNLNGAPVLTNANILINSYTTDFSTIPAGTQTYGKLRFSSQSLGPGSKIVLQDGVGPGNPLFASLNIPTGGTIEPPIDGTDSGVQNDPVNPASERERLLTHAIFFPFLKVASHKYTIKYTIRVVVENVSEITVNN